MKFSATTTSALLVALTLLVAFPASTTSQHSAGNVTTNATVPGFPSAGNGTSEHGHNQNHTAPGGGTSASTPGHNHDHRHGRPPSAASLRSASATASAAALRKWTAAKSAMGKAPTDILGNATTSVRIT
ncbi:hypothetical protein BDV95DRAFT_596533 [Massariosphaeria phaeospora]|uniref:Uncharacterized protein n=1 Tax=Massariosphaeria phaeospora TaxID=100035 RepID=A0A7C8I6Q3_9PLEO|nr:hypothetical protein BDV95DRAFT_596533 [Massariosphaeria phaeospora]